VTDSSWIFIRFQSRMLRFYSTDDTSGRYYMSSQAFPPFHCIGAHALGSLVMFVAYISTSFAIPVPRMRVFHHCKIYCYLPQNYPGLKQLNSCVNLTGAVQ
jgi:hypothetical protein